MEEGDFGGMKLAAIVGRLVAGRPNQVILCDFVERRKRKGFENFVMEARVDE